MGMVLVKYEVLPESIDSMEKLEENLKKLNPKSLEKKPIAFGLNAFEVSFVLEDNGGEIENIEKRLEELEGAGSVKSLGVTLI